MQQPPSTRLIQLDKMLIRLVAEVMELQNSGLVRSILSLADLKFSLASLRNSSLDSVI